ncbi:hypothetical protein ACFX1W_030954 [Malus domestica]
MSSLRRVYKQLQEQQKRLLAQQAELANLEEGGGGDEAFLMEEDEDDHHRRQKASHSHCVMEAVGQIAKPRRAANLDRKREKRGLIVEQKITASLRMLAYGASADQVDGIARMGKTTVLESLMQFYSAIEAIYTKEYLRTPTPRDMRRLLRKGEMRGFPGMIGSIDYMHWTWKNCPRAHNDLNVIAQSSVFDKLLQGKSSRCTYWVNGTQYEGSYYLADGIYPRAAARMFDVEVLRSIMMTCIIFHNMIVKDEYDYDVVDEYEPDPMNNSRTRIYYAHDRTEDPVQHESLERDRRYNELIVQRYTDVQEPYWHVTRQNDLIEHQWGLHEGKYN